MKKNFKIAVILTAFPILLNIIITILCFINKDVSEYKGYLTGTMLGMFFSIIWLGIAKKVSKSNAYVLFTFSLGAFPIKILLFVLFAFGGLYFFKMDQLYFSVSFLFNVVISLVVELWYILAINREFKKNKNL